MVWGHFQQQLCKWLMLGYFLRLKPPFGNSYICANTENMFTFDMWESAIWDLNVKLRNHPFSGFPVHMFSCLFPAQWQCRLYGFPSRNSQSLLFCAVINIRSETLAGNVNLDGASKTQQNNWWSCQVQSFNWTKPKPRLGCTVYKVHPHI